MNTNNNLSNIDKEWAEIKAKHDKARLEWENSPEMIAYRAEQAELQSLAIKAMNETGVKYGDSVEYVTSYFAGFVGVFNGILINKKGIPYVKLSQKYNGKASVRWNKGWRKI